MKVFKLNINQLWQHKHHPIVYLLRPLSYVFRLVVKIRRSLYACRPKQKWRVPIVIVGNISVGGNGKTPVVIGLANALLAKGLRPGIVSRGYGGKPIKTPRPVGHYSHYFEVGDEPLLIANNTTAPVVVCASRVAAVKYLLAHHDCDVVLSDDGLQHYALARDFEIALLGSQFALGNAYCLPAGPLREPLSRLKTVDWVMGDKKFPEVDYAVEIECVGLYHVKSDEVVSFEMLNHGRIFAFAGIAHPERFFNLLKQKSLVFTPCIYPDHYRFVKEDFDKVWDDMIVMTEKDATKCREFASNNMYYIKIKAKFVSAFVDEFFEKLSNWR
jgi:tetraacyldisaccharide 4'-kinase